MIKELTIEELYLRALSRNPVYRFMVKYPNSLWSGFQNNPFLRNDPEVWKPDLDTSGNIGIIESELDFVDITYNRIESQNGYKILCGYSIPVEMIKSGQKWIGSGGHIVTISNVTKSKGKLSEIEYEWIENGELTRNEKDSFNFQCRYCLILEKENQ